MSDRVPLPLSQSQATVDTTPDTPDVMDGGGGMGIEEFQDKRDLSLMLGFDDQHFDGYGEEADRVYEWAKESALLRGKSDSLLMIKSLIRELGISSIRGDLLKKLNRWVILDSNIRNLKIRQEVIRG